MISFGACRLDSSRGLQFRFDRLCWRRQLGKSDWMLALNSAHHSLGITSPSLAVPPRPSAIDAVRLRSTEPATKKCDGCGERFEVANSRQPCRG